MLYNITTYFLFNMNKINKHVKDLTYSFKLTLSKINT